MAMLFENYDRRVDKINKVLAEYSISSIEECKDITAAKGIDVESIVRGTQPICFDNAVWAYTVGCAIAIKKGCVKAADAAAAIGEGLQSFCIPGSVAENRKVGLGHGNLGKMLLSEETDCFCFLAGHESFAAAEGAIKIALNANKVRQKPLRVILNGLGKDAAQIISFDPYTEQVTVTDTIPYSKGPRADVKCYGADNVPEGVAIMKLEHVSVSITGNSTNPTRFQHPVAGIYKKWCNENGIKYFSVASGGGTGCRSFQLRHDGHYGQNALGRSVRRFFFCSGTRRDDGSYRYGQQPDGRRYSCMRCCRSGSYEQIISAYNRIKIK